MQPYSLDLRQKIIDVYKEGSRSQRQLARQFRVALSFIQKLIKQYKETGNVVPKVRSEQTPTKLSEQDLKVLSDLVSENNDATLAELSEELFKKTGVLIRQTTIHRMLGRLQLTFKKKRYMPQKNVTNVLGLGFQGFNLHKNGRGIVDRRGLKYAKVLRLLNLNNPVNNMEKITQAEQDYLNLKLLISESKEGMSFIQQDNKTVSRFLKNLSSLSFEKMCDNFFKLDDDRLDKTELILLRWLKEIQEDITRVETLKNEVEQFPIYEN